MTPQSAILSCESGDNETAKCNICVWKRGPCGTAVALELPPRSLLASVLAKQSRSSFVFFRLGRSCFPVKRLSRHWGGCGSGGGPCPGSCSHQGSPLQSPSGRVRETLWVHGNSGTDEAGALTKAQCSTHSEAGAKVRPPETLTALFWAGPALHHPLGEGASSTSPRQPRSRQGACGSPDPG